MEQVFQFDFVHDTQHIFRKLMDAMARPMTKQDISANAKKFSTKDTMLFSVGVTLLDNETSFYLDSDPELQHSLANLTLAQQATIDNADYIFVPHETEIETIHGLFLAAKQGTLSDPHLSATFLIGCETLEGDNKITLTGPGIQGTSNLSVSPYLEAICKEHNQVNLDYPCGIDLYFVTKDGFVAGLPRLCKLQEKE